MRSTLGEVGPAEFAQGEKLCENLLGIVAQGFTIIDEAIIFTAMHEIAENVRAENFPDVTGFECFVNHIHVEDQLHYDDPLALLRQGVAFGLAVWRQLRSAFPSKPFKVIVAATAPSCGVRFHLVRPGEEWLASDLDGYQEEAILVLENGSGALSPEA
jgi:hypothetical protein